MTDTLREKLLALKVSGIADFTGYGRAIAARNETVDACLTLLDEHCAGQRERFEEWNTSFPDGGYIQSLKAVAREAWQAAFATITGKE